MLMQCFTGCNIDQLIIGLPVSRCYNLMHGRKRIGIMKRNLQHFDKKYVLL